MNLLDFRKENSFLWPFDSFVLYFPGPGIDSFSLLTIGSLFLFVNLTNYCITLLHVFSTQCQDYKCMEKA